MKNVGIHVLDFNDNIIDFISQSDGALLNVEMSMNVEEKTETFDFTIENTRAEKLRECNRIIAQDNNGIFREFIIIHIIDNFDGTTEIECNASYLEDLKTAKPIKPGKFEAHTTTQALLKTLADTGWEVSDDTEYGGNRTTSWTSHTNPFDLIYMLCTTYSMVPEFYIELSAHSVEHRYVSIAKPKNLFKGKEITKGKDLTGMTRTIDLSEVKTALLAVGPEKEDGSRIETVVVDDEAQEIFGLPNRYIWDVYEPESNDENMTLKRLTTLAKTELNKRNQAAISYEVSSIDIHKYYNDVTVHLRDIVRVKDRDFRPPLYIEAEVIGIKYNWLADESEFTFGNVIEYEETKLREFFNRKLDEITKKLNDSISNVNTIVSDVVAGELEYYERKIFKGSEPPENPQNDTLWYDTSNPDVAVLRRYVNGEWRNETAKDVEQLGGMTREKVLYNSLTNTFANLNIQHSKLLDEVYKLLNNEYLVDDDLRLQLDNAMNSVINVYNNIKTNLDSMTPETATIGKLIDTQALFLRYRERLQDLYKAMRNAQIAADDRLKLLQSQYTDKKFNDAMNKIAETLPNGRWDSENQRLYADIPNRNDVNNVRQALQEYTDGQISDLNSVLGKEIDIKINTTKSEINANISSVERKIDGIEVGGRNLIRNSEKITDYIILSNVEKAGTYSLGFEPHFTENIPSEFGVYYGENIDTLANDKPRITHTFEVSEDRIGKDIRLFFGGNAMTHKDFINNGYVGKVKLEYGNFATDYTLAPEDLQNEILVKSQEISKAQADAAETRAQAYADSKITNEEQARIRQADANLQLLQQQQQSLKDEMAAYTDNLINEEERARIDADAAKEEALKAEINLAQTQANAYADDKITAEEERAIQDAQIKFEEAKKHAEEKAAQAQSLANEYAKAAQENAKNYTDNKVNNLSVGSRNLLEGSAEIKKDLNDEMSGLKQFFRVDITSAHSKLELGDVVTVSFDVEMEQGNILRVYDTNINFDFIVGMNTFENIGNKKQRISFTKKLMTANKESDKWLLDFYNKGYTDDKYTISNIKIEKGNVATDWTPAPEDLQRQIQQAQKDAQEAAQAYANAQDELKQTEIKAYADGIVSDEEQRAIADAIAKRDEAKEYAEQKAQEAQEAANKNTTNQLKPITTRVTTNETNISELDKQISLMAKSDDVEQKLRDVDGRLTPLETTVESNKATLDILPTQIDSKVSKEDYTLDKNGMVQRLDNADSQRKQLSNEITDKVTITKFESGITEAKNHANNIKKETENYTDNQINNLDVGSENLLLDSERRSDGSSGAGFSYIRYYLSHPLETGKTYTLKADIVTNDERQSGQTSVYPYNPSGIRDTVDIKDGQIAYTFMAQSESTEFFIYKDVAGQSNVDLNVTVEKAILVEGDKVTGWAPANEDVKKDIQQAETNAKAYTDEYKRSNDVAMTKLETSITQNGDKIALKVDEQKFNASRKTLSQVISEISATTKGINLSYDENGNIQSYTMDKNGIQLRGDKVDITVNKDFNVVANRVNDKVGKDEIINRLNLSPEGLDIDVNKVGIRGGGSTNYVVIKDDEISLFGSFQRTWRSGTETNNVYTRMKDGYLRFRNNEYDRSIYMSDFGISTYIDGNPSSASGTLAFFDYSYDDNARGVTLHSGLGVVAMRSENNRVVIEADNTVNIGSNQNSIYFRPNANSRVGVNEFSMYVKLNDTAADTDGVILYGEIYDTKGLAGSGIRFKKKGIRGESSGDYEPIVYATDNQGNIGTGSFYANNFYGDLAAKNDFAYVRTNKDGRLRITDFKGYNNGNPTYTDLQCHDIQAESIRLNSNDNFYVGVSTGELRVTNNLKYNGGDTGYKPVRASAFNNASLEQYKTDIKKWDYDALTVIANDLDLYQFKYKNEEGKEKGLNHRGVVIGRDYKTPDEFIYGDGVNLYEMVTWSLRAIQQLNEKINKLEEQLNEQPITS